jgi:hypothetical protein
VVSVVRQSGHLNELRLKWLFLGARRLRDLLRKDGFEAGRTHVETLMYALGGHCGALP